MGNVAAATLSSLGQDNAEDNCGQLWTSEDKCGVSSVLGAVLMLTETGLVD